MSGEREWITDTSWGMQVGGGQPEGQVAELDIQWAATPRSVAQARHLFEQAEFSDFEPVGVTGRKFVHKETGRQFLLDQSQILMSPNPTKLGIKYFCVHAGRLWFMRARDHDPVDRGVAGEIIAGEVRQSPGGGMRIVSRSGAVRDQVNL